MKRLHAQIALAFGGLVAAVACGPSISSVYEGNVRFEHCYRLDMDPNIAAPHRRACWQEWTRRYTYGQTRDRLEYAKRRVRVLSSGDVSRAELQLGAEPGAESAPETPMPTSVHKPPPPTLQLAPTPAAPDAGGADASLDAGQPAPPGTDCSGACRDAWRTCRAPCDADGGPKARQCKTCDLDYRRCVQRCLE